MKIGQPSTPLCYLSTKRKNVISLISFFFICNERICAIFAILFHWSFYQADIEGNLFTKEHIRLKTYSPWYFVIKYPLETSLVARSVPCTPWCNNSILEKRPSKLSTPVVPGRNIKKDGNWLKRVLRAGKNFLLPRYTIVIGPVDSFRKPQRIGAAKMSPRHKHAASRRRIFYQLQ